MHFLDRRRGVRHSVAVVATRYALDVADLRALEVAMNYPSTRDFPEQHYYIDIRGRR